MGEVNDLLIRSEVFIAISSSGPATLAIFSVSMSYGRMKGLTIAAGVQSDFLVWSFTAAFGLATLIYVNTRLLDDFRYVAAFYLVFLAYRSLRSSIQLKTSEAEHKVQLDFQTFYLPRLFVHLTNPKTTFFFGALYSLGLHHHIVTIDLIIVIFFVALISSVTSKSNSQADSIRQLTVDLALRARIPSSQFPLAKCYIQLGSISYDSNIH